jgi:hypothetical protein
MSETAEKTKKGFYPVKFGFTDCLHRLAYKLSSQKLVSFVFAATAIFVICWFAVHAGVLTAELAMTAIRGIRDVALGLLVARGGQDIVKQIVDGKNGRKNGTEDGPEKGEQE